MTRPVRLAIVVSHPIQYYAPWFRELAAASWLHLKVFHLWDFGIRAQRDPGFGQELVWDIDLLSGYESELLPNWSYRPGTDHLLGLINPGLLPALRAFAPDAVLAFGYSQLTFMWLALRCPWPLLLRGDSHALAGLPRQSGLKAWLRRHLLQRASAHLSVGQANRDWLLAQGVDAARIFHAPHAVDQSRFLATEPKARSDAAALRRSLGIAADELVIGFVGKLETKKQPLLLIEAFRRLRAEKIRLVLVGNGNLADAVEAACQADSRVLRLPFRNQTEMPATYALMDALVLPSLGAHETWGLVLNEAQIFGLPCVVSSHVGAGPDLIEANETGWVFASGELHALQAALESLLQRRGHLHAMQGRIRERAAAYSYAATSAGLRRALAALGLTDSGS